MTGENLPPQEVREESRREFLEIHDYALQVKIQLQQAYGYFGDGSIHFANAYFPVVFSERVEVWKGDIFAGSAGLDPANGLLKINQGGDYGSMEYFGPRTESVFNSVNIASIKESLGRRRLLQLPQPSGIHLQTPPPSRARPTHPHRERKR